MAEKQARQGISLRLPLAILGAILVSYFIQPAHAGGFSNETIPWPTGLLLLAAVLYAALGTAPDELWTVDPSIGIFLWRGLPKVSIPTMQRVSWVANACHFTSGIKPAYGISNFWVPSENVSATARAEALAITLKTLSCTFDEYEECYIDESIWHITSAGLLTPAGLIPVSLRPTPREILTPSANDFLLFAAIDYHVFREWEVRVEWKGGVFSTKGMGIHSAFEVDSEEDALPIVAAQMVRRPHGQSPLRSQKARNEGTDEYGPYVLQLDNVDLNAPICDIDFHSYAAPSSKVRASLRQLAGAYHRVSQYIKATATKSSELGRKKVAHVDVGQSLWIAILGGAILDEGRLTFQNLPSRWGIRGVSADEAYVSRVKAVLELIKNDARKPSFFELVYSGGISRNPAIPFLIAGLGAQMILCFFLAVGTSASIWTSVAITNIIFSGKVTDLHSLYYGKTKECEEPGMKMRVPGKDDLLAIATFDRTSPRQGALRPGLLLNVAGLIAATLGFVYRSEAREALGFEPFQPIRSWIVYTASTSSVVLAFTITLIIIVQQIGEKTWWDNASMPTRWMIYSTLPCTMLVAALGSYFHQTNRNTLWPILDALTWISGFPLGMIENGRLISVDDNVLHLVLVARWLMAAVASAVASSVSTT